MGKIVEVNELKVVEYYLQPNSIKKTCKHFSIGEKRLRKILAKHNVDTRKPGEHCRVYNFNEDFFYHQSEELAYTLGLIAADGCVAERSNQVYIELRKQDAEVLEKIREAMGLTRPIKFYVTQRGYENCKLYIEDKNLKKILIERYHLPPNKTYNHKNFHVPLDSIDYHLIRHYIRGFFDGDGSVKKATSLVFQLDSTCLHFLTEIQQYLLETINIQLNLTSQFGENRRIPLYRLYCYGNKAKTVLDFLYKDNPKIYMKRKFEKFQKLIMK